MVFSSHIFLFYFLPLSLLLYYGMPQRGRLLALTLVSYVFYGWSNPYFVLLMAFSTAVDFLCGLSIANPVGEFWRSSIEIVPKGEERTKRQRVALFVSICTNLSLLGFFKYANFGLDNFIALREALGLSGGDWDLFLRITLPLGISFYTFQSMSYTIDVYRGDARAIRRLSDFACYVAMFPQLVAGPIVRFHEVAAQLESRRHSLEKMARGVAFLCFGLAKKVLLANPCGKIADTAFDAGSVGLLDAWYGVCAYAFQIYFDFSAYSDMAIGLGLMFGFVFPKNFDRPYLSQSITEFWQRWHLSLSHWLRDYLYVPLGGNRKGWGRTYVNLATVMVLGGLWHGASWNFVIWGGLHGGLLVLERAAGKDSVYRRLPKPVRIFVTFVLVLITWVFFRAEDVGAAFRYLGSMFVPGTSDPAAQLLAGILYQPYYWLNVLLAGFVVWVCRDTWDYTRRLSLPKAAYGLLVFCLAVVALTTQEYNPFIYFIF